MNKIALYGLASVLALSLAACDSYEEPNPQPQTNPQESILKTEDVSVASAIDQSALYDLAQLNSENGTITLATIRTSELPEAYEFAADVYISANGFERSGEVASTVVKSEEEDAYLLQTTPDDLQAAYFSTVSKGPKAKDVELRFNLKTVIGNQVAYVGGPNNFYGPYTISIKPFPSSLVIEDAYYLLGSINDWSVATALKFNHSDADPYDDPVFSIAIDVTADQAAAGWWWKIIPASTYEAGDWVNGNGAQYGPENNGEESMAGMLIGMEVNADGSVKVEPGAGCLKTDGQLLLTINLEEGTYEFSSAVSNLYTPGDANGWNAGASMQLYTEDYSNYLGYALLSSNGFKFTTAPDWDHTNFGDGGAEGVLSADGSAGNLSVPETGLYWCNVNIASLSYSLTHITTIGLIGDACEYGWDASVPMTTTDNVTWKATVTLKGGEFKFRCNDGWDINLGGDLQNLTQGGSNIASPGAGTYEITLYLGQLPYSATVVAK